jgi:hypothetical protein
LWGGDFHERGSAMEHRPGRWLLVTTTAALLLLGACGDDALPPTDDASTTTAPGTTSSIGSSSTTGSDGPDGICENPPPEEIGLGSATTAETTEADPIRCFWVQVPEGVDSISFQLSGMASDLALNVGYGFLDAILYHIREFWRSNEAGTSDEVVVIDNPRPGPYFFYVGPAGFGDFSAFEVGAETTPKMIALPTGAAVPDAAVCAEPATVVQLGSSVSSEVVGREDTPHARAYFCVEVPDGLGVLAITVSGLEDNLDLLVRLVSANQQWTDPSRGGTERSVVIESPPPGAYYIDLASALTGASSEFTLTVESS